MQKSSYVLISYIGISKEMKIAENTINPPKNITEKRYVTISLLQSLLKHYLANTAQPID